MPTRAKAGAVSERQHSKLGDAPLPETYHLNMGPQHPSMHGVLRLVLHLDGERILDVDPVIGYAHRAHEKMAEHRNYLMFLPNTSRVDYLSGMIYNLAYCQAVEKMLEIEVPERAEYIRVICSELNRISSHLLWFGTFLLDIGGITPFLYAFDDREQILEILDRVTGSRLTYCYGRFGGLTEDVDTTFLDQTRAFVKRLRERLPEYHALVTGNVIFRGRCEGVGVIDQHVALAYGVTGPCLRAAGIAFDVRRAEPYGIYDRFEFDIPTEQSGDALARYKVRVAEIEQSLRIIEQAVAQIPDGPIMPDKPKKRFKPAAGELYFAVESARGQFGIYIVSDGSEIPFRIKLRTPSFSNLAAMPAVLPQTTIADTIAIVGSIDVVIPEIDR
ncbi:MAG: NADH-quinone oxidoreductase subunit D [Deltaproteobacteria bacterium]|nr:NADH-quinone oxidoreductase subunit D [Deltaproteobacteria bacterium]